MATIIDLGCVVPVGKGDWNASTTYERTNLVRHNSAAWVCSVATSTGVEPTDGSTDWYLLVADTTAVQSVNGQTGAVQIVTGDGCLNGATFNGTTITFSNKSGGTVAIDLSTGSFLVDGDTSTSAAANKIPKAYSSGKIDVGYLPNASTSARGAVQLSSSTSSTSTTLAATPSAVRAAYNLANTANSAASTASTNASTALDKANEALAAVEEVEVPAATETVAGIVKLSNAYNSNDATVAATSWAVQALYKAVQYGAFHYHTAISYDKDTEYEDTGVGNGLPFMWAMKNQKNTQMTGIRGGTDWRYCPSIFLYGSSMADEDDQSGFKGGLLLLARDTAGEANQNYVYIVPGEASVTLPAGRAVTGGDILFRYCDNNNAANTGMWTPDSGTWIVIYWRVNNSSGYGSVDYWFGELAGGTQIAPHTNGTRAWAVCIRKWD